MLAFVVILLVLFLGAIIKIIIDQNKERRDNTTDQKVREDTRQTERLQMTEAIRQQTPLLEAIKAQGDKATDRDSQSAIAVNAMSQALSLDLQEKVSLKEFWSGTLKELKALREDYAAGRSDYNTGVEIVAKATSESVDKALGESLREHKVTQEKIDKLPDELINKLNPLIERLEKTIQDAKTRFLEEVAEMIKELTLSAPAQLSVPAVSALPTEVLDNARKTPPPGTLKTIDPFNPPLLDTTGNVISSVGGAI